MQRVVETAADVEPFRQQIEEMAEGLVGTLEAGGSIDWDDFLNRVERSLDIDLGESMESPAIKMIQRIVRQVIRESRA